MSSHPEVPVSSYPEVLGRPLVCDMTLPQGPAGPLETPQFDAAMLERARLGVTFTSVTIASDELTIGDTVRSIGAARRYFAAHPARFTFVERAGDIRAAHSAGKTAVNLHFQGSNPLLGDLNMVEVYRRLGVGHMLLAYNYRTLAGDGCHEGSDAGLSVFGKELIAEMNRARMIVDLSHTGLRTAMDAISVSAQPVIVSHSNSRAVFDHERNISDELAKAVAATGGVIGVNGVGLFLSAARHDISAEIIAKHADHYARLVGPQHVGIGLDAVPDLKYFLENFARKNSDRYRVGGYLKSQTPQFAGPQVIPEVAGTLLKWGWSAADVRGFLGENWMRVMEQVW
jgi:membrane dipeptidase